MIDFFYSWPLPMGSQEIAMAHPVTPSMTSGTGEEVEDPELSPLDVDPYGMLGLEETLEPEQPSPNALGHENAACQLERILFLLSLKCDC